MWGEAGIVKYLDLSTFNNVVFEEKLEASLAVSLANQVSIGGSFTSVIDAETREWLRNEGFAGISIGDTTVSWDAFDIEGDITLSFEIEAYIVVGGSLEFNVNLTKLYNSLIEYDRQTNTITAPSRSKSNSTIGKQ